MPPHTDVHTMHPDIHVPDHRIGNVTTTYMLRGSAIARMLVSTLEDRILFNFFNRLGGRFSHKSMPIYTSTELLACATRFC